jgi:HEPN domain-containing protein
MAAKYLDDKLGDTDLWLESATTYIDKGEDSNRHRKHAAFHLHQAAETAYACFLLVRTLYFPRSHNIKFLRSLGENNEPRLIEAWPRAERIDRRRFELLKRAYVEARYSDSYEIGMDDLWLSPRPPATLGTLWSRYQGNGWKSSARTPGFNRTFPAIAGPERSSDMTPLA